MKKILLIFIVLYLILPSHYIVYAGPWYKQTYYLTVIVRDDKSNAVIPYAEVAFDPLEFFTAGPCQKTILTDSSGKASYNYTQTTQPKSPSVGKIYIDIKADSYKPKRQQATIREDINNITTIYLERNTIVHPIVIHKKADGNSENHRNFSIQHKPKQHRGYMSEGTYTCRNGSIINIKVRPDGSWSVSNERFDLVGGGGGGFKAAEKAAKEFCEK